MTFLLILMSKLRGCGPKATPPPVRIGDLTLPARARPVPFWRYSLAVEPLTCPRLGRRGAGAARGLLGAHDQVQRVDVGGHGEAGVGQLARLDFLARRRRPRWPRRRRPCAPLSATLAAVAGFGGRSALGRSLGLLGGRLGGLLGAAGLRLGLVGLGRRGLLGGRLLGGRLRRPSRRPSALAAGFLAAGFAGLLVGGLGVGLGGRLLGGRLLGGRLLLGRRSLGLLSRFSLGLLGLGGGLDVRSLLDLVGAHGYLPFMTTTEFLAPGTEPLMSSRLFSTSLRTILRPCCVTRCDAHVAAHAHALEHSRGVRARADRPRGPHVVRTVSLGTAAEVVPLDGALEALALAHAGRCDGLAVLERLDGDGVADLEVAARRRTRRGAACRA